MTPSTTKWNQPTDIDDVLAAFPGSVSHLMPPYSEIPEEFLWANGKWNEFFSDMFYSGIKDLKLNPRDGVDTRKALRHMRCVASSYEPEHEHKEAAVAYLMSLWFEDSSTWECGK